VGGQGRSNVIRDERDSTKLETVMGKEWEKFLNFRCTCCGNCCREPIVLITDEDIRRIRKHTGQEPSEIAAFYPPSEIEWGLDNPGWIKINEDWRIMGLVRKEDGCQFLGEDDLCGIYDHRPVACRRYPFDVEFDEKEELSLLGINDSVECPYELDGRYDKREIKALVEWEDAEEQPYFKRVEAWNKKKQGGGPRKFFEHIDV
tara:strand:- start:506 stop:1114 length:609 start_codon:yes stop_codon:yes gene_type:complete